MNMTVPFYKYEKVIFNGIEVTCAIPQEKEEVFVLIKDVLQGLGLYGPQCNEMIRRIDRDTDMRHEICIIPSLLGMYEDFIPLSGNGLEALFRWIDKIYYTDADEEKNFRAAISDYLKKFFNRKYGFVFENVEVNSDSIEIEETLVEDADESTVSSEVSQSISCHISNNSEQTSNITPATPINDLNPLTREELAAYMLCQEQHIESIKENTSEFTRSQTEVIKNFINSTSENQRAFCDSILSVINKLADSISMLTSSYSAVSTHSSSSSVSSVNSVTDKQNDNSIPIDANFVPDPSVSNKNESYIWRCQQMDKIEEFCQTHNFKSKTAILKRVYDIMQKTYGINFFEYKVSSELSGVAFKIDIASTNNYLRGLFENCLNEVFKSVSNYTKEELGIPDIIYEEMTPLIFEGEKSRTSINCIYHEMEKRLGKKLKDIKPEFCEKTGLKHVTTAYMVANTPELLEMFREAVKSFA